MKLLSRLLYASTLLVAGLEAGSSPAASLMLDFGQTSVAAPYLTLSPGHNAGTIPLAETSWNKIASASPNSSLLFSDGTAASGVTLTLGQESTAGNNTISYSTAPGNLNLVGTGGAIAGQQNLLTANSIYGSDTASTAVGRDGIFGGGNATAGSAIGLRLDGLAAGTYSLFVMARNVNSDAATLPMNLFAAAGASAGTFNFSTLTATPESNIGYAAATYANQYGSFVAGENYVSFNLTLGEGESLFLAVDGGSAAETRGFLNSVEVVATPEPATGTLLGLGFAGWLLVQRKRRQA